jgi:hypothetical protein
VTKGQVIRADDGRTRPHSEAHRAAIKLGLTRARWKTRQFGLARVGMPHAAMPMTERVVEAFSNPKLGRRRYPVVGECHACYLHDVSTAHVDDDPEPVEDDAVTLDRAATDRVTIGGSR